MCSSPPKCGNPNLQLQLGRKELSRVIGCRERVLKLQEEMGHAFVEKRGRKIKYEWILIQRNEKQNKHKPK